MNDIAIAVDFALNDVLQAHTRSLTHPRLMLTNIG